MKKNYFLLILILNLAFVYSQTNSKTEAKKIADNYLKSLINKKGILETESFENYFSRSSLSGDTFRYQQQLNNIPVYESEIVIHVSPKNEVTFVTDNYSKINNYSLNQSSINDETAISNSALFLNSLGEITFDKVELNILNSNNQTTLVHKVIIELSEPRSSWEILVDSSTGEVLKSKNRTFNSKECQQNHPPQNYSRAVGSALVWIVDPLVATGSSYGGNYSDNNDATNATLDAARSTVTLPDIQFAGGNYTLISPYAEIVDTDNPTNGLFQQATPNFNYNRSDAGWEAVMCFYHLDLSMRYINEDLTVPCMPFQYAGGMRFDPHGLNGADNSHYLGGSGVLEFGEGGVDDGECGDVILHELGHGIHDFVTGGNLSQVNGLSEGTGDYWAQSHSREVTLHTAADAEWHHVFKWDGHNEYWGGRVTNTTKMYPGGLVNQVHADGEIWATVNMEIYDIIGKTKMDRAFLEGLANTGGGTDQPTAALAVRQAAIDLGYTCAEIDAFTQRYNARGYNLPPYVCCLAITADQQVNIDNTTWSNTISADLCQGQDVMLRSNLTIAGSPTYTWSGPGGFSASGAQITLSNVNTFDAGTYSCTISMAGTCGDITQDYDVMVTQSPFYNTLNGNGTICSGEDAIFNLNGQFSGTVNYNINGGATQSVVLGPFGNGTVTITGVTADTTMNLIDVSLSSTTTANGNANTAVGGTTPNNATGTVDTAGTAANNTNCAQIAGGDALTLTLDHTVPAGTNITVSIARDNNQGAANITDGTNNLAFNAGPNGVLQHVVFTTGVSTNTIDIVRTGGRVWIDGVEYSTTIPGITCSTPLSLSNTVTVNASNPILANEVEHNINAGGYTTHNDGFTININDGDALDLRLSSTKFAGSWLWTAPSGTTYTSETVNFPVTVDADTEVEGSWSVQASFTNDCGRMLPQVMNFDVVITPLLTTDFNEFNGLAIYPNPTSDIINITSSSDLKNTKLSLVDLRGRIVLNQLNQTLSNNLTLDLSSISQGSYFLVIENDTNKSVRQIIKK